jgi:hypothetical protein
MNQPQNPNQKKGLSGLAMAGIGCGVLLLAALVGGGFMVAKIGSKVKEFAGDPAKAAVWALEMNPDIEVLKKDDAKREITFKQKSTGETSTISYEDLEKGKLTVKNDKGEEYGFDASKAQTEGVVIKGPDGKTITAGVAAASAPPAEVPQYPGLKLEDGAGYRVDQAEAVGGMTMGKAPGDVRTVKEHYEGVLKSGGYEVNSIVNGEYDSVSITGKKGAGMTSINVMISRDEGTAGQVVITTQYQLPKK